MIIDQLPTLASVQETDEIPVERGTTTYKTTLQKVKALIASLLTKADIGLGNVDNVQQYSADNPPPYPVTSVNGQTGTVTIQGFYGIDTENVLVENIATSWTATQDCWLVVTLYVGTTNVRGDVGIDGVTVGTLYYYHGQADSFLLARSEVFPIKAGQTIERQNATGDISALTFTVYGIK